jgi:hypothetical protein
MSGLGSKAADGVILVKAAPQKIFLTSGRMIHPTPLPQTTPDFGFVLLPAGKACLFLAEETFSYRP